MSPRRFTLALLYLTATLSADGAHAHVQDAPAASGFSACFHDSGPHAESRGSNPVDQEKHECPACQFRAQHHGLTPSLFAPSSPGVTATRGVESDTCARGSTPCPAARGPPRRTFA